MPGRAPYLLFASFLGAALALLIYRFGALPLGWSAPQATLLVVAPVVLVVTSWRLIRQTQKRSWPWLAMVAVSLPSFGGAMLLVRYAVPGPAHSELVARRLPGMTVSLPSGKQEKATLEYLNGEVMLSDVAHSGGLIALRWSPGKMEPDEDTDLLAKAFEASVKGWGRRVEPWPGPGGATTPTIVVETDKGRMTSSLLGCGERRVFITGLGNDTVHALTRRVLRSFVCQPDPAKEQAFHGLPWTLTLPEGWHAYAEDGSRFSDGESQLMVEKIATLWTADVVRISVETLFGSQGAKVVVGPLKDERFSLEVTDAEVKMLGWVRQYACPRGAVIIFSVALTEAARDAADQLVKDAGRCLSAEEAAPRWTVPEEAKEEAAAK